MNAQTLKNNIPLVAGLALPVLMIIFVAGAVYSPRLGTPVEPQYDFLYMTQNMGPGRESYIYTVKENKLVRQGNPYYLPAPEPAYPGVKPVTTAPAKDNAEPVDTAKFYIHGVKGNTSREISFKDAEKLSLDSRQTSPDGFEVTRNYGGGGSIFTEIFGGNSSRDYDALYLTGHGAITKLNLQGNSAQPYYYAPPQFLGWIMK